LKAEVGAGAPAQIGPADDAPAAGEAETPK
jgi:hypothetical protein